MWCVDLLDLHLVILIMFQTVFPRIRFMFLLLCFYDDYLRMLFWSVYDIFLVMINCDLTPKEKKMAGSICVTVNCL